MASRASATVSKTGRLRCLEPPFPGLVPPTILVPYAMACSEWKVPFLPVKPWQMTLVLASIITADPQVKGILVNIFGGIMKCDVIARGVIAAVKAVGLEVPLVVRLEGTNVEEGKEIIRNSGLNVIPADDLDDAAQKIVAAVKKG